MSGFSEKLGLVGIILETSEGTEQSPLPADFFLVEQGIRFKPMVDFKEPNIASDSLSPEPGIATLRSGTLTFRTYFKASGAAGTVPEIDKLFKAAAFTETIEAARAVFYDAAASTNSSATVVVYIKKTASSGKKYTFRGCRINWKIDWTLSEIMYIDWEVTAADWTEFDVTSFPAPTFQTSPPVVFQGANVSLADYVGCISKLSIDSGANIVMRQCAGSTITPGTFTGAGLDDMAFSGLFTADYRTSYRYRIEIDGTGTPDTFRWSRDGGETWVASTVAITGAAQLLENGLYITFAATTGHTIGDRWDSSIANSGNFSAMITSFVPSGAIDPEEVLIAINDAYGKLRAGTTMILSMVLETSAGNNLTVYAQSVQYKELTPAAREEILILEQNLKFNKNTKTVAVAITAFADNGDGKTKVTSAAHGLGNGAHVTIAGTTNYNGDFNIEQVTTNTHVIDTAYVADDGTGTWVCANGFMNFIFT